MTGQQPFPDGTGGAVYFSWPDLNNPGASAWQYLGMISNVKPSAIFKVGKAKPQALEEENMSAKFGQQMMLNHQMVACPSTAQVGISIEPLSALGSLQQASMDSEAALVPKFVEFTQKMVQSLFNYTASFALDINEARMKSNETYVPYSAVQQWCTNFERRIKLDPYFWTK